MTILEILEAHYANLDYDGCFLSCECGWIEKDAEDRHLIHQAEVLEKHMQEREAEARANECETVAQHVGHPSLTEALMERANEIRRKATTNGS